LSAPPQTYNVAVAAARISSSTVRVSNVSSSATMDVRPRRTSTAAIVVFPAPEQPVIWTALIGIYRRPIPTPAQTSFANHEKHP